MAAAFCFPKAAVTDPLDQFRVKAHSGAMVALMLDPSDTGALASAMPPGLTPEPDLHITLAYLGKAADLTRQQSDDIDAALSGLAQAHGPVTGIVSGMGYFNQDEEGQRVLYASFDAPALPELRQAVVSLLTAYDVPVDDSHGFTPHITLAYTPNSEQPLVPELPVLKITFPSITRILGGDGFDFPFNAELAQKEYEPLTVIKQADGAYRWVLISSNSFEDRDREIVSQKALEADVVRADVDKRYGPLLWWHLNGKRNKEGEQLPRVVLGECDFNAMHGRMLIESGLFVSEAVAVAVEAAKEHLEVSLGFEFPETALDATGVIHAITRTERSLLPRGKASNLITAVPIIQKELPMLKDKLEALTKVLGGNKELVSQVLQLAETGEKEALAAGVRTKAKADDEKKPEDEAPAEDKPNGTDAAADAPFPKAEAEDDAKPEDDEKVKKKEFEAVITALVGKVDQLSADLHILTTASAEKATRDADTETRLKEATETLATIKQVAETAAQGVLELKGELPRKLGDPLQVFRPSQSGREVSTEKAKDLSPKPGPMDKHYAAIIPNAAAPTPPGL